MRLQPIDADVAHTAGVLRLSHKLKTPDALHLSAALRAGADVFVTNDAVLFGLKISGLKIQPLQSGQ